MFACINVGNCISLAVNQDFGSAGELNLRFIFGRPSANEFAPAIRRSARHRKKNSARC
jgi:hypothetical protein